MNKKIQDNTYSIVVIIAGGDLYEGIIPLIPNGAHIIATDRAALWLIRRGVIPDTAVGDFDSVSAKELRVIQKRVTDVRTFAAEKDFTDSELAVKQAIKMKPARIIIFAGIGSRMDHTIGVFGLLEQCNAAGIPAELRNKTNSIQIVGRGRTILERREGYTYVSIIPITNTIRVTLSAFKYNITNATIRRGQTIGISNEFIGATAMVGITAGKAFVIQSRD